MNAARDRQPLLYNLFMRNASPIKTERCLDKQTSLTAKHIQADKIWLSPLAGPAHEVRKVGFVPGNGRENT